MMTEHSDFQHKFSDDLMRYECEHLTLNWSFTVI